MDNFFGSLKNYGLVEGISLYFKLKNFQIDSITTSKLQYKVHLRPGSTDNCVFKQIFLKQDLNIPALDSFTPQTIIDLGANIGMSSLYLADKFPDSKIIGVEPDEENGEMFKKNLEHFPNVSFELAAVRGDHKKIVLNDHGKGATGYVAEENEDGMAAVTISDIMKKYSWETIDVIKMDIEGSEISVFEKNYDYWLKNTKILLIELHERKAAGCTAVFNKAVGNYNFERSKSGEYEVLVNKDLI
jgi:FkbM family methyltransferase